MIDLINSITKNNNKKLLVLLGDKSSENIIRDICVLKQYDELVVICENKKLPKKINDIFAKEKDELYLPLKCSVIYQDSFVFEKKYNDFILLFDGTDKLEKIKEFSEIGSSFVYGAVNKNKVAPIDVWELFRKNAEYIYIFSFGDKKEILEWNKNESGVELSVIFPVYKVADYLDKCLESISEWKAEYVEFLFVDDGSPDNSAEIIKKYSKLDNRIKLLSKENGGCASARQFGLEKARGNYVGFIDPDDFIDPTMFQKLLSRAMEGSYEISYCGYNEYYENNGKTKESKDMLYGPYANGTIDRNQINNLLSYLKVAIWRCIFKKDLIDRSKIKFHTDLKRFDDLPFKFETFSKARSVVSVPEYLYYYRLARPGQDVSANDERLYVHFPIFNYLDEFVKKSSDQTQLDYLQYVKLKTHLYAIKKIDNKYLGEYVRRARKDMNTNFKFFESLYIINKLGGKKDCLVYVFLKLGLGKCIKNVKFEKSLSRKEIDKINTLKNYFEE